MRISIKYNILKLILLIFFIIISAGCAGDKEEAPKEAGTPVKAVTEVEVVTEAKAVTPVQEVVAVTEVVEETPVREVTPVKEVEDVTPAEEETTVQEVVVETEAIGGVPSQENSDENATEPIEEGTPAEDPLDNLIKELEKPGKIESTVPEKMKVDETKIITAYITKNISENTVGPIEENETYISTNITVTPKMKVTLDGKQREAFIIEPRTDETQHIIGQRNTAWSWSVTPQKTGKQTLILTVYLVFPPNSGEPGFDKYITELEKEIEVEVSSDYILETYLPRVEGILKVVAGILGSIFAIWKIIIPLVNNIRNRSKK